MGILIAFKVLQNGNRTETFENDSCVNMEKLNKCKKINILNFATWNVRGISYKKDQLDDILAKKSIKIAAISESKRKLKGYENVRTSSTVEPAPHNLARTILSDISALYQTTQSVMQKLGIIM
jgi:hypothetical protein